MVPEDRQHRVTQAFDRIEGTILPCIGLMLESLIDAAEAGRGDMQPEVYAEELRRLALQLEALTKEIGAVAPARAPAKPSRSAAA